MTGFSYLAFIINTYNLVLTYGHHIFRSRMDQSSRKHMFYARFAASCFWTHRVHHVEVNFREGLRKTVPRKRKGGKMKWGLDLGSDSLAFSHGRFSRQFGMKTQAAAKFICTRKTNDVTMIQRFEFNIKVCMENQTFFFNKVNSPRYM